MARVNAITRGIKELKSSGEFSVFKYEVFGRLRFFFVLVGIISESSAVTPILKRIGIDEKGNGIGVNVVTVGPSTRVTRTAGTYIIRTKPINEIPREADL